MTVAALIALELVSLLGTVLLLYGRAPAGRAGRGLAALRLLTAELGLAALAMALWIAAAAAGLLRYDNMALPRVLLALSAARMGILAATAAALAAGGVRRPLARVTGRELLYLALGELALAAVLLPVILAVFGREGEARLGPELALFTLGSLALTAVCCLLVRAVYRKRAVELQRREALELLAAQERYYTRLLEKENETRAFRHDIRGHMTCLRALCESGDTEKLRGYLDDLEGLLPEPGRTVFTGNGLVDVIVGDLLLRFPQVELKVFGCLGEDLTIAETDLCTVFSNLLSNAFEAAARCEDRTVTLRIKALGRTLLILVENPAPDPPAPAGRDPVSTKEGPGHGYGLANVRGCLSALGGDLTLRQEGGVFEASALIPQALGGAADDRSSPNPRR